VTAGAALTPLLCKFPLNYAIREVQENQVGVKLNGTHQLLLYADDVNLLGNNMDTVNKNERTLIDASKEFGLEVNTEKTKHYAGQNHDIKRHKKMWRSSDIWEQL
jgi:hypothetical protein